MVDHCNLLVPYQWRVPFSLALCLTGMITSLVAYRVMVPLRDKAVLNRLDVVTDGLIAASNIDPHIVFYTLLPPLLYESAASMSHHVLKKVMPSSALLALPGVIFNIGLTGVLVKLLFNGVEEMSWGGAFLLASVLSATDPVAVVSALHHLGAPKKISTLIEGESLLNDGSAVVFFFVFLDMATPLAPDSDKQCPGASFGCIISFFCSLSLGGLLLGLVTGYVMGLWLRRVRLLRSPHTEVVIILATVYGTFVVAEALHVSGVLAVVGLGSRMTSQQYVNMSLEGRQVHQTWFSQWGYMCNQAIFFIAGMVCYRFLFEDSCHFELWKDTENWLVLLSLFCIIHITRTLTVAIFSPLLVRWGYGLTLKEGALLIFGGLRGAVGLSMGLIAEHHAYVDRKLASLIAFHTSGIVVMTLLINGSLVDEFYNKLHIYPVNPFKTTQVRKALVRVEEECMRSVRRAKADWLFHRVNFDLISRCVPDLRHVDFDDSGMPHPHGMESVRNTLHAVEALSVRTPTLHEVDLPASSTFSAKWRALKMEMHHPSHRNSALRRSEKRSVTETTMRQSNGDKPRAQGMSMGSTRSSNKTVRHAFKTWGEDDGPKRKDDERDYFSRVRDIGFRQLEYDHRSQSPGCYISARAIGYFDNDQVSFTVVDKGSDRGPGAKILVGLYMGNDQVSNKGPSALAMDKAHLGTAPNSIGLDCINGKMFSNIDDTKDIEDIGKLDENVLVIIRCSPATSDDPEFEFTDGPSTTVTVEKAKGPKTDARNIRDTHHAEDSSALQDVEELYSVTLPGVSPDVLFPAVEFVGFEDAPAKQWMPRATLSQGLGSFSQASFSLLAPDAGGLQRRSVRATTISTEQMGNIAKNLLAGRRSFLGDTTTEEPKRSPSRTSVSSKRSRQSGRGLRASLSAGDEVLNGGSEGFDFESESDKGESFSEDEIARRSSGDARRRNWSRCQTMPGSNQVEKNAEEARMRISLKIAADDKKSPKASTEAAAEAKRPKVVLSFEPLSSSQKESISEMFTHIFNALQRQYGRMHEQGNLSSGSLLCLMESLSHGEDCANNEVNAKRFNKTPQDQGSQTVRAASDDQLGGVVAASGSSAMQNHFEPLLVEYYHVENFVASDSIWDHPWLSKIPGIAGLSFYRERMKIETLWAFVEAHERVINYLPNLERKFPELHSRLCDVVQEAKHSMAIVRDVSPARFHWVEHMLALRVMLTMKREKLKQFAAEGWISRDDSHHLDETLQETLFELEHLSPGSRLVSFQGDHDGEGGLASSFSFNSKEKFFERLSLTSRGSRTSMSSQVSRPSGIGAVGANSRPSCVDVRPNNTSSNDDDVVRCPEDVGDDLVKEFSYGSTKKSKLPSVFPDAPTNVLPGAPSSRPNTMR
eukprot:TRINITY_DN4729_c0_g1_i1.p1 TRINITY_DN4729_c0_g1~~TRINITY_DN4729_c0_g1_i1.p1  ORF type:complete len:1536 (-),score=287.92 TRINITY_DN4729_c0_g1_i1:253-4395(-)